MRVPLAVNGLVNPESFAVRFGDKHRPVDPRAIDDVSMATAEKAEGREKVEVAV